MRYTLKWRNFNRTKYISFFVQKSEKIQAEKKFIYPYIRRKGLKARGEEYHAKGNESKI